MMHLLGKVRWKLISHVTMRVMSRQREPRYAIKASQSVLINKSFQKHTQFYHIQSNMKMKNINSVNVNMKCLLNSASMQSWT